MSDARSFAEVTYDERDAELAQQIIVQHLDFLMEHLVTKGVRDASISTTLNAARTLPGEDEQ